MSKDIVISKDRQNTRVAIVESGQLTELFIESDAYERTIGNLFLGRVRRIMPSIQAAFVDIGQKQDAFLHFSDLNEVLPDWLDFVKQDKPSISTFRPSHQLAHKGRKRRRPHHRRPNPRVDGNAAEMEDDDELERVEEQRRQRHQNRPDARTRGKRRSAQRRRGNKARQGRQGGDQSKKQDENAPLESYLKRDQPILVKISKEPISAKGSRITTDISLAGRFVVLVPMANYVAVSKKISSFKERRRLRALARMLLPDGFGLIVRTVAEGQTAKSLDIDLRLLLDRWNKVESRLAEKPKAPAVIYEDVNMVSSVIRDLFSDDFNRILIDDPRVYRNIRGYVKAVAPEMAENVTLHEGEKDSAFKKARIDRQIAEAFQSRVNLPSGGYLFIERTEAMHVVDVNSGRAGKGKSQEENSLAVNLEAVQVIAKQIRLRDLGGILVIDFIDMRSGGSRRKVYEALKREFRKDRAVTKVLPMSDFGLMEITRQRLRPSITTTFSGEEISGISPSEMARPSIEANPEELRNQIKSWLGQFRAAGHKRPLRLVLHPFAASYFMRSFPGPATRWRFRFRLKVRIEANPELDPMEFRFEDGETGDVFEAPPEPVQKPEKAPAPEKSEPKKDDSSSDRSRGRGRSGRGKGRDQSESDDDSSDDQSGGSGRSGSGGSRRSRGGSRRGGSSRGSGSGGGPGSSRSGGSGRGSSRGDASDDGGSSRDGGEGSSDGDSSGGGSSRRSRGGRRGGSSRGGSSRGRGSSSSSSDGGGESGDNQQASDSQQSDGEKSSGSSRRGGSSRGRSGGSSRGRSRSDQGGGDSAGGDSGGGDSGNGDSDRGDSGRSSSRSSSSSSSSSSSRSSSSGRSSRSSEPSADSGSGSKASSDSSGSTAGSDSGDASNSSKPKSSRSSRSRRRGRRGGRGRGSRGSGSSGSGGGGSDSDQ